MKSLPVHWPGVGRFSDTREQHNEVRLIELAKRCPLLDDLRARTSYDTGWGRPREPGEAALALIAWVVSGAVDVKPWFDDSSEELWVTCGFGGKPTYDIVRDRFLELEEYAIEDFFEASAVLIRWAIEQSDGTFFTDVHIDCTEADDHVRLHHDCQPGEGCQGLGWRKRNRHGRQTGPLDSRALAPAASRDEAKALRQAAARGEADDAADLSGEVEQTYYDEEHDVLRIRLGGHWWTCRDTTAGSRAIRGKNGKSYKTWTGFHSLKVVCHTSGEVAVHLFEAADVNEPDLFEEALERLLEITGPGHVRSAGFDAGFSYKSVFMKCAEHGITGIGPFRRSPGELGDHPPDTERFDRDGIPRCKHCGGETDFVRFAASPKPRIWFKCLRPTLACCKPGTEDTAAARAKGAREQTIYVEEDPRYLLPLWRNTPAYQALRELGLSHEAAHHKARTRNGVGGKDVHMRPKRPGREWQQLRANASAVADWLKVLYRQGWLPQIIETEAAPEPTALEELWPEAGRGRQTPEHEWQGKEIHRWPDTGERWVFCDAKNFDEPYIQDGSEFVRRLNAQRRGEGLHRPYGRKAAELGIGEAEPPSGEARVINLDTGEILDPGSFDPADLERDHNLVVQQPQRERDMAEAPVAGEPEPGSYESKLKHADAHGLDLRTHPPPDE